MKGLQAIIFDAGNVLVGYDEALLLRNIGVRCGKSGVEIAKYVQSTPYVTQLALGKLTGRQFYRTVAHDLGFAGNYDEFTAVWCEVLTPIEPMMTLAAELATKLPRVLLSNTNAIHMEYVNRQFPLLAEFDAQILSHEVGLLKPDSAIFHLTLRQCGVEAERTLFVDDLQANVDGARAVGMQALRFENAGQVRAELTKFGVLTI